MLPRPRTTHPVLPGRPMATTDAERGAHAVVATVPPPALLLPAWPRPGPCRPAAGSAGAGAHGCRPRTVRRSRCSRPASAVPTAPAIIALRKTWVLRARAVLHSAFTAVHGAIAAGLPQASFTLTTAWLDAAPPSLQGSFVQDPSHPPPFFQPSKDHAQRYSPQPGNTRARPPWRSVKAFPGIAVPCDSLLRRQQVRGQSRRAPCRGAGRAAEPVLRGQARNAMCCRARHVVKTALRACLAAIRFGRARVGLKAQRGKRPATTSALHHQVPQRVTSPFPASTTKTCWCPGQGLYPPRSTAAAAHITLWRMLSETVTIGQVSLTSA